MRVAALAVLVVALACAGAAWAATRPPARLQVTASEYSFGLSRASIKSGRAIIELVNFGEDAHDLRLRRVGGTRTYAIRETQSGDTTQLATRLRAGRFVLWCSIADHRARGMHATLVVRP